MTETGATLDEVLTARRQAGKTIVNVDQPTVKLVVFECASGVFAFHAAGIREILADAPVFFVPGCPPSIEGVINLRGDIESVIDLGQVLAGQAPGNLGLGDLGLGRPADAPVAEAGSRILIGHDNGMTSGLRVERVLDVTDLPCADLQPPPAVLPERLRRITLAVLRYRDRPATLLDLGRLFQDYAGDHS